MPAYMFKNLYYSFIVAFIFLNFSPISAQSTIRLSPEAKISLLTCSPGDELYSIFGHSAIRVTDSLQNFDNVFNYGTFDFDDPNFYTNFVRGKLNYKLSAASYRNFEYQYVYEGRWIWEQELNLTRDEKQYLFDSLVINYHPENQYYLYDFFFDNCATRIRDIFTEAIEREIRFNYEVFGTEESFRELLMPYLSEKPWARLGINLALGLPADKIATPWEYMFLPDHMMTAFGHARFIQGNNSGEFTTGSRTILEGKQLPGAVFRNAPLWVFLIILMVSIILSHFNLQSKQFTWWYDRVLFGLAGLLGILITFLWFGTDHQVTVWNLNILWAHPFHFIIIFFLSARKYSRLLRYYFMVNLSLLILLIFAWPLLPQTLPWMVMPFIMALIVRSAVILRMFRPDILAVASGRRNDN
jgi:hypothetical protein